MTIKRDAINRGIRLTYERNGTRVRKTESRLIKEIRDHDDSIISRRAKQTKGMILMCKSIMSALGGNAAPLKKVNTPFMTPQSSPVRPKPKPPPPPPPPPSMKKMNAKASMLNALKKDPRFLKAKKNLN